MRTKVTLVLVFLNVALFFVIFQFERSWRTESVATEIRKRILGAEAADIRTLEVRASPPGTSYRVERRGNDWFVTSPIAWRANQQTVKGIVNDLEFLEHVTSFKVADLSKEGTSLADYGLAQPALTVTFTSGGPDTTGSAPITTRLAIGSATQDGQRVYVLSPDRARVEVVSRHLVDSLSVPFDRLRADTVFTIPVFEATELNVQRDPPTGERVMIHHGGDRWLLETPIAARASKEAVELTINSLDQLRLKNFVDPGALQLPTGHPYVVTIEGNLRYEKLTILDANVPGAPGTQDRAYFARFEDSSKVISPWFTVEVPDPLMASLRDALEKLRDPLVLDIDPSLVTKITLKAPKEPDLTLERLDADGVRPVPAGGVRWQVLLPGNGAQGPATLPADTAAVEQLLNRLALLKAGSYPSIAPQASDLDNWGFNLPVRKIVITEQPAAQSAASPARPAIIEALDVGQSTPVDANLVYARTEDAPRLIYGVDPEILKDTPVAPRDWRDRFLRIFPESGRVTSLEIFDLVAQKPATAAWDASSGPPSAAVKGLIGLLPQLRAARIVSDTVPEGGPAGAPDGPWHYALKATVALPGAGGAVQNITRTVLIAKRTGGGEQLAGYAAFGVFALEQPAIDALWTLIYGGRDPGPPPTKP